MKKFICRNLWTTAHEESITPEELGEKTRRYNDRVLWGVGEFCSTLYRIFLEISHVTINVKKTLCNLKNEPCLQIKRTIWLTNYVPPPQTKNKTSPRRYSGTSVIYPDNSRRIEQIKITVQAEFWTPFPTYIKDYRNAPSTSAISSYAILYLRKFLCKIRSSGRGMWGHWLDWSGSGKGQVAGTCKRGNEPLGSI